MTRSGGVAVGFLDDGSWSACFGLSYRDLVLTDAMTSRHIVREGGRELRQQCGTGGIVDGRNAVMAGFLDDTDAEWLWMIDTDMGFAPDTVEQLVASGDKDVRPVVGGLCFRQRHAGDSSFYGRRYRIEPTLFNWMELPNGEAGFAPVADYPRDQLVLVGATGAACLLVHRRVGEAIRSRCGDNWFSIFTHPTADMGKPRTFSEDLSFCIRAAACDIPLHVNTAVKTTHDKHGIFLDEAAYDRDRAVDHGASD